MTDAEFCERYEITSVRGRVWTRSMLVASACRSTRAKTLNVSRAEIVDVIDDPSFLAGKLLKGLPVPTTEEQLSYLREAHLRLPISKIRHKLL